MRRSVLIPGCVLSLFAAQVWAAPSGALASGAVDLPARELRQLHDDWQRGRTDREMREFERKAEELPMPRQQKAQAPPADFRFLVKSIGHTASVVLSDDEFNQAVAPWVGRTIEAQEIADILDAVNAKYRDKGFVVCQAVVRPQRIRGGHLEVTLIEGRTESATVTGNATTREDYILSAFDLKPGEVANYRDMIEALVRFNMVHDTALKIDIGAGSAPMSTAYRIEAQEPPRWTATVFGDTTGSESTGRPRIGASLTNRSVLGLRDSLTALALASEGSKSGMIGYSLPITPRGTRLSASVSVGSVEVVDGASADFDVSGDSTMASLRLEHPVWVTSGSKYTLWGEVSRQTSETDMFGEIRVAEAEVGAYSIGMDAMAGENNLLFAGSAYVSRHSAHDRIFDTDADYSLFNGMFMVRKGFRNGVAVTLEASWQSVLSGDALNSADYFYLGHNTGVRGYENDIICAEAGFAASVEAGYPIAGEKTWAYAFFDMGRLTGARISSGRSLYSTGVGLAWPLFDGAHIDLTASFPLKRDLDDDAHVNRARADLMVVMTW